MTGLLDRYGTLALGSRLCLIRGETKAIDQDEPFSIGLKRYRAQRGWSCKRTLVATTDKQVFTSAESREQQARWLELADTALHNRQREKEMNPGTRAREQYQQVNRAIGDIETSGVKPMLEEVTSSPR